MAITKRSTQGTTFQVGDGGSPESFTAIDGVRVVSWPGNPTDDVPVTDLASTAVETVGGLPDLGEMTIEIVWDFNDTLHKALYDDYKAGTTKNYQRVDPDASTRSAAMYPRNFSQDRNVGDALVSSVTMRITGDDTYAQGTP